MLSHIILTLDFDSKDFLSRNIPKISIISQFFSSKSLKIIYIYIVKNLFIAELGLEFGPEALAREATDRQTQVRVVIAC